MNANIHLQGHAIVFEQEEIHNADGTFELLADINGPVTIPSGRFARIPTPIAVKGDGRTLGLLHVMAGRADDHDGRTGQFLVLSTDDMDRVHAIVQNDTPNALIIHARNSMGTLEFVSLAGESEDDLDGEGDPTSGADAAGLRVPTVYAPKHIDPTVVPQYATAGAAAFDLRADIDGDVVMEPGGRHIVPTGLRMAIPVGYEGQVRPRSGLAAKSGITVTNSPGTIDSDYRGEIMVILQNTGPEAFTVTPADRIGQLLIAPVTRAGLDFVDDLDDTDRGSGGFGSTGRK